MIDYERIKDTRIEDFIFIIYYLIITLSLYSNKIERDYLYTGNDYDRTRYRILLYIIFGIAFLVYLYYTIDSYKTLKEVSYDDENRKLYELSFLASFLVLISGCIYLYIISNDEEDRVELAFN
ncbi:MAG: hypothetical protein MR835_00560 [Erysipelotrichaceae bacterium]|nr:hypothetical protein [Erysipelotrichaceae bacterium]MDY3934390.1 hypothetical protein [Bacilli bacterium]